MHSLKVISKFNSIKKSSMYPYNVCIRSLASIPNDISNINKKDDTKVDEKPLTMGAKIKKMWKNYGILFHHYHQYIFITIT